MMIPALAIVAAAAISDPRVALVELQIQGRTEEALAAVESSLATPGVDSDLGLDFLRGHLLEELERPAEAHRAFAAALNTAPGLTEYTRYRLALNQARLGHPEVAAGLIATLLGKAPPQPLIPPATALLIRTIGQGADCGLLRKVESWRLPGRELRKLRFARAECELQQGIGDRAAGDLIALLREETADEPARRAAEMLDALWSGVARDKELARVVGTTFHHHRQFDLAERYLTEALGGRFLGGETQRPEPELEALYELARSHFWREEYLLAATRFGQLASQLDDPSERARPLYQQGRCYELNGNWDIALKSFQRAYVVDPESGWAGAALLSMMRIEFRSGNEAAGAELYELLGSQRRWQGLFARGAMFLAASDLVRGRTERARGWIDDADRTRKAEPVEIGYWRGRLAELQGKPADAVAFYVDAIAEDPFDPLAEGAAARLADGDLAAAAQARARRLAGSTESRDLYRAWLLLGDADPTGSQARAQLAERLARDPRARDFLDIQAPPPAEWPLWQTTLRQPEEHLLALGIWAQGSSAVLKHFPVNDIDLGFTGSWLLARARETTRSLYVAEILRKRVPRQLPDRLLPEPLRQLLYPFPYRAEFQRQASRQGIDPRLLSAVVREESRFDPEALSAASARGLTQFVLPTAQRLAGRLGLENLTAADLHDPSVSIALGAGYLAELSERFDGETHVMVAAYNAGESQAQLWRSYCYSRQPEEFLTKVGFRETRGYLKKVLRSWNQYREIYPETSSSSSELSR